MIKILHNLCNKPFYSPSHNKVTLFETVKNFVVGLTTNPVLHQTSDNIQSSDLYKNPGTLRSKSNKENLMLKVEHLDNIPTNKVNLLDSPII